MEKNLQIFYALPRIMFLTPTLLIEPEGSLQNLKDQDGIGGS